MPPDLGLGPENAGISAARLLFHLPPRVALTLVAALLLERRIILVASAEDKVGGKQQRLQAGGAAMREQEAAAFDTLQGRQGSATTR